MFLLQPDLLFLKSHSDRPCVMSTVSVAVSAPHRTISFLSTTSGAPHFDSLPQRVLLAVTMRFLHTAIEHH
jgi:hypothetical protein